MTISKKRSQAKKKIKIKKMIETSLIDWEGMMVSTLYVGGCNFRCPFCYNVDLVINPECLPAILEKKIFLSISERNPFIDGICLSGGEPTIYDDLIEFLNRIKSYNLKIKLDTNGSHPEKLADIIDYQLVDYIAMDIKNCLQTEAYTRTIRVQNEQIITKIKKSIELIMVSGVDYEFRTTVVPGFHNVEMIESIAKEIKGAQRYILQNFIQPEKILDPCLKDTIPFSEEKIQEIQKKIEPHVQICSIR